MAKGFQLFPYYRSFLENNPFTSSLQTFAPGVQSIVTLGLSYLHVLVLRVQMHYIQLLHLQSRIVLKVS